MEVLLEQTDAAFDTTHWTVLAALRAEDESIRRDAARRIAETYWPPVYAAARRMTRTRDEAAELTQGFFADVVCARALFEQADRTRGTLRSLIRSALKRYATDQWRRSRARGHGRTLSLGELDREDALQIKGDTESAFDRRWALALFEHALCRSAEHFASSGRAGHWRLFEARVLHPAVYGGEVRPLTELAPACGFASPAEAAAALQTVKRRLDAIFREVVGETIAEPKEFEAEYRAVREMIERA